MRGVYLLGDLEEPRARIRRAPDEATEAFSELLRSIVDAQRFPALHRAVEGGAFAPVEGDLYAPFDFGLDLLLDGIEGLIRRQSGTVSSSTKSAKAGSRPSTTSR